MAEGASQVVITPQALDELATELEKFASTLPADQQTMLTGMILLADRQLQRDRRTEVQLNREGDNFENLRDSFEQAFSRFAPEAFPKRPLGKLAAGTVCIE
jgi:hypothetical protein